jgi:hypothetical protein
MQTALHSLIQSAPVCKPIKADLRASTVTFEWPANVLVQRTPYVVVPQADVQQALALSDIYVVFRRPNSTAHVSPICDDIDFQVNRGHSKWTLYFERRPDSNRYRNRKPGTWWGGVEHMDTEGREWRSSLPDMVINDFGDLVSCETGARP